MKTSKLTTLTLILALLIPLTARATSPCDGASFFVRDRADPIGSLTDYLSNPPEYETSPGVKVYCLKFNPAENWIDIDQTFNITLTASDKDMYVSGLNISKMADFNNNLPLLTITNYSNTKSIYISGLIMDNVKHGLKLAGTGNIMLTDATITGDADKSGTCLVANSTVTVTGGTFSNCSIGAYVNANNVQVINATIRNNKYGAKVAKDKTGTKFSNTAIYANNNPAVTLDYRLFGVNFEDGIITGRDLQFETVSEHTAAKAADADGVIRYDANETAVIKLPSTPSADATLEFFYTEQADCGAVDNPRNQACARVETKTISARDIATRGYTNITIATEHQNKANSIQTEQTLLS